MSEDSPYRPEVTNVHDFLGIRTIEVSNDRIVLELDVNANVHQPYGILHGGVSALLAEGAASIGGGVNVEPGQTVVGTELNISHLRPMRSGVLTATATPIRKGRSVHRRARPHDLRGPLFHAGDRRTGLRVINKRRLTSLPSQ
jgi:uncharacterized protein (TIGR00369 family)